MYSMHKVIFLVDMNAFFISCEMTRNPSLAGKPSAVAGDPKKRTGIILAANYEARAYGVRTAMVVNEAEALPKHDVSTTRPSFLWTEVRTGNGLAGQLHSHSGTEQH